MEQLLTVANGVSCVARRCGAGWYGVVLCLPEADEVFVERLGRLDMRLHDGMSAPAWTAAVCRAPRTLELIWSSPAGIERGRLTAVERIRGFDVMPGGNPGAVWIEQTSGEHVLRCGRPEAVTDLVRWPWPVRNVAAAAVAGEVALACETGVGADSRTLVLDAEGDEQCSVSGRNPQLVAGADGLCYLLVERVPGPDRVELWLCELRNGRVEREIPVPSCYDRNFQAAAAFDAQSGQLLLTFESCPAWGANELAGQFRDVCLWRLEPGAKEWTPGSGTGNGIVPLPRTAFYDTFSAFNATPFMPQPVLADGQLDLTFKRFRFVGMKGFGWDLYRVACRDGRWTDPARISPNSGGPDGRYSVLSECGRSIVFQPCCDHQCRATFAEEEAGQRQRDTWPAYRHRVELLQLAESESLPAVSFPEHLARAYVIPQPLRELAPDPPVLNAPTCSQLVWADLHPHSAYSKCMSAGDGSPQDVLRLQRDVLGCRVLTLIEHVEYMRDTEFHHVQDAVEAEAGEHCVPLYGAEWGKCPAHHTNFYAIDRDVFEHLRAILLLNDHLTDVYGRLAAELPQGSVVAIRHFHGMNADEYGTRGAKTTETHDARFEWAMETMQTRGNILWTGDDDRHFPADFLNAGALIGFVGGSDHSRGMGPNRFCLTGLWLDDLTPEAVLNALRTRRTIAVSNGKIAIAARIGGARIGETVDCVAPVRVSVEASCARRIRWIGLIRDGGPLAPVEVGAKTCSLELTDEEVPPGSHWYSVTAEADSTYGQPPALAHASPLFANV